MREMEIEQHDISTHCPKKGLSGQGPRMLKGNSIPFWENRESKLSTRSTTDDWCSDGVATTTNIYVLRSQKRNSLRLSTRSSSSFFSSVPQLSDHILFVFLAGPSCRGHYHGDLFVFSPIIAAGDCKEILSNKQVALIDWYSCSNNRG